MSVLRRSHTSSSSPSSSSPKSSWIHLRSLLIVASSPLPDRGSLRSPWSRRKRKHALTRQQWNNLFMPDGKLRDGGVKFLKKVRRAGIDPSIRADVWPFLLGVYDLKSSKAERNAIRVQKRKEYEKLRRRCWRLLNHGNDDEIELNEIIETSYSDSPSFIQRCDSTCSEEVFSARESFSDEQRSPCNGTMEQVHEETPASSLVIMEGDDKSGITHVDASADDTDSSDSESTDEEPASILMLSSTGCSEADPKLSKIDSVMGETNRSDPKAEDFATWQRIMRLDAVRANAEWVYYSSVQAGVSEDEAFKFANAVGLKDFDHLEPCQVYHASRLVAVLEAYALYDPEIGYCQGMSDLLSPILAVMEDDHEAFWCFVGFMKKARHNFRLDEVGIKRQLNIVSKIIKSKDSHLYRHLEKLQAEDCFFMYRMVVVMFRRELTFEQTLCLWEVMWADQAAIRARIGNSVWARIRLRAPPTDDLLLYAIAASVLQRRKLIIEKYSSMDEILRECNSMAGQLDVWKLLDDAHHLVVTLHDKIE
ncbi:rab GTPase-activating protein 22 isoform X1 [Musa acuminata AAA Group]|uniref:rab GTPase-activating protein 22 isoform X1 n=1 Tax=Musa acuminata AAA Group TaxID=214697 RepID=UPI0031E3426A